MQEYFEPLVQKEKMEEKMKSIREMKCRAVTCKTVSQQICYSRDTASVLYAEQAVKLRTCFSTAQKNAVCILNFKCST